MSVRCQKCGTEVRDDAKFCPTCGSKIELLSVPVSPAIQGDFAGVTSGVWPEWKIVKQLGRGSYGVVYQAVRCDNNVESHAAIKVISIPSDASEVDSMRSEGLDMDGTRTYFKGIVDDFVSEIQMMESLKGIQNIVSVEDYKVVEKTDGIGWTIYIRMELLTPFNTFVCDKNLSEQNVIKLGYDICNALEICSQKNVIHRDIKPENIFINSFGHYKLGDFGIARKLENMTGGLSQKGTYNYMAPEVANSNEYDARVDTYSLGIVLYRLLNNNRLPFLDEDKQLLNPNERKAAVERRIRGEALPAPCNASPEMAHLILRACAHDPKLRFASASEMKQALMAVANGTYVIPSSQLDRTTPLSTSQQSSSFDVTTSVRKAPQAAVSSAQPAVSSFSDVPKQEKKRKKKGKLIAIATLIGILALAITLLILFFSSAAYGVFRDIGDGNYEDALEDYESDVEDKFVQELILKSLLKNRVNEIGTEYNGGKLKYEDALRELSALNEMGFDGSAEKRNEIMAAYAEQTVEKYNSGEINYEEALNLLLVVKEDGYEGANALIDSITKSNDADNALEKADQYYANGNYESAISEYSKVPETDENYQAAQEKLNQVYQAYISESVTEANRYNSSGSYKDAIQRVNTAYSILPDNIDTSELEQIKNEALVGYKTEIAGDVADFAENNRYSEAFALINEAIAFDDNSYFQDLKTSTETKYVDSVTTTVQNYLATEDYISAMRVAENALTVLPGNTKLKDLKKDVENKTPTYLMDVCKPYAISTDSRYKEYINGELMKSGGTSYTNGFTLDHRNSVDFNLDGKYSSLGFLVGHLDGSGMENATVKVYCDGVLKKEIAVTADGLPQRISIDVTGVRQLKFEQDSWYAVYCYANITVK